MRVCFVVSELFGWGFYGGFGALTRTLGRELAKKGLEVYVVMPKNAPGQKIIETVDGIKVLGIPSKRCQPVFTLDTSLFSWQFFAKCDADIYHSEEPSIGTYIALKAVPTKKHIITFQDPRTIKEELQISRLSGFSELEMKRQYIKLKIQKMFISEAARNADALFCQARFAIEKARILYKLKKPISFLPNPVSIPEKSPKKSHNPKVCFLGRWDPVKRPTFFFKLAEKLPGVDFVAMGKSPNPKVDHFLRNMAKRIKNLEHPGFVSEEEKQKILDSSWILVNTSIRECLPVSFLEAAAHKCAILSKVNPDNFASNFGLNVGGDFEDYLRGIAYLIEEERWKKAGEMAYNYVKENHEMKKVIEQHISIYKDLMEG
jgi:glycosyltransferase involved in cell wall biosynthesis